MPGDLGEQIGVGFQPNEPSFHAALDEFGAKWNGLINSLRVACGLQPLEDYVSGRVDSSLELVRLQRVLSPLSASVVRNISEVFDCKDDCVAVAHHLAGWTDTLGAIDRWEQLVGAMPRDDQEPRISKLEAASACYRLMACMMPSFFQADRPYPRVVVAAGPLTGEVATAFGDERKFEVGLDASGFRGLTAIRPTGSNGFNGTANDTLNLFSARHDWGGPEASREKLEAWQRKVQVGKDTWERTRKPHHLVPPPPYVVVEGAHTDTDALITTANSVPGVRFVLLGHQKNEPTEAKLELALHRLLLTIKDAGFAFSTIETTNK